MKNRNKFIDITKGLGIIIVVLGHNWLIYSKRELFNIIWSFHMPLFFFLSGLFFSPFRSLASTIASKSDTLLKPYFITLILLGLIAAIFKGQNFTNYFLGVLYGNGLTIPFHWIQMWFIPHLFAVTIFSWLTIYVFQKTKLNLNFQYLFIVGLLIAGVYCVVFFWKLEVTFSNSIYLLPGLPFSIDILPITMFFFLLGYFLKNDVLQFKPYIPAVLFSLLIFSACHYFFNKTIILNDRIYDGLFIPTIEALSGIYIILSISYMLQFWSITLRLFSYIGSASLFIMIFHRYFDIWIFFGLARNFPREKYFLIAIFAFVVSTIMPLIIWSIIKKIDLLAIFFLPIKSNKLFQRNERNHSR